MRIENTKNKLVLLIVPQAVKKTKNLKKEKSTFLGASSVKVRFRRVLKVRAVALGITFLK